MNTATIVMTTLQQTGAELPTPITDAATQLQRTTATAGELRSHTGLVAGASLAAIDAGRDPLTDKAVQRAIVADQFAQTSMAEQVNTLAAERFTEALHLHSGAIISALQTVADTAAATIRTAGKTLGAVDPGNPDAVLRLGGRAAEAWAQHQGAAKQLDSINTARGTLAQALRWSEPQRELRALRWAALTLAQLDDLGAATPEQLVRAGITLALAEGTEVARRLQAIERERQAHRAADEQRARNEYRAWPVQV